MCARFHQPSPLSILEDLTIEPGTFADYKQLARFHYKGDRPGAVTAVYRMIRRAPTVIGRYLNRRDEMQIVGVLVISLPQLSCQLRDLATNNRYRGLNPREAAVMLNREVRTISRVVIEPQWRGLGLAVKLVRHALAHPIQDEPSTKSAKSNPQISPMAQMRLSKSATSAPSVDCFCAQRLDAPTHVRYTEALAAMGRVSPFFEHAGMTRYDRPPRPEHERLIAALRHLQIEPWMLASIDSMIGALPGDFHDATTFVLHELRRWHRAAHRTSTAALNSMTLRELLVAARNELLSQPVYFLYRHEG